MFNDDLNKMKNDCLYIKLNELIKLFTEIKSSMKISLRLNETQNENTSRSTSQDDNIYIDNSESLNEDIHECKKQDENNLIQVT